MTAQNPQVASATPLFYRIDVPFEALIGEDFDAADVKLSIVQTPSKYRSACMDGQATFNANDERDTLLFIMAAEGLEFGRQACELVFNQTPFEWIKNLLEKNREAKSIGWVDRELNRLDKAKEKVLDRKLRLR